ncbi:MAG: hypothetical protein ACLPKT_03100 [Methylocella sp.]
MLVGGTLSAAVFASDLTHSGRARVADPPAHPLAGSAPAGTAPGGPSHASARAAARSGHAPRRHRAAVAPAPSPERPPSGSTDSCTSSHAVFAVGARTWPDCTDTGMPAGTASRPMNSPGPTGDGNKKPVVDGYGNIVGYRRIRICN